MIGSHYSQVFMGVITGRRVLYRCCSKGNAESCDPSEVDLRSGRSLTDVQLLLTLVAEVAEVAGLPDMYFLFNTGDQPFTDKVYWSPVPQFHWVRGSGHWTIPLPNPFQLKAHFLDLLGDSVVHEARHVPWAEKLPKVFWRGTLSAPDSLVFSDIDTLPRVRLMNIAAQHPELFDVGITGIDSDLSSRHSKAEMQGLLKRVPQVHSVKMAETLPRFRYVINVSAVLSSWRLAEMLASGSLLLLQEDSTRELIYEWLTPWEHFVPVSTGLSDLVAKVNWLEKHPEQAEAIARRGFLHFRKRIRRQDTYCYLWQALSTLGRAVEPAQLPEPKTFRQRGWTAVNPSEAAQAIPSHTHLQELIVTTRSMEL